MNAIYYDIGMLWGRKKTVIVILGMDVQAEEKYSSTLFDGTFWCQKKNEGESVGVIGSDCNTTEIAGEPWWGLDSFIYSSSHKLFLHKEIVWICTPLTL